jgi:hypothetical protein
VYCGKAYKKWFALMAQAHILGPAALKIDSDIVIQKSLQESVQMLSPRA